MIYFALQRLSSAGKFLALIANPSLTKSCLFKCDMSTNLMRSFDNYWLKNLPNQSFITWKLGSKLENLINKKI